MSPDLLSRLVLAALLLPLTACVPRTALTVCPSPAASSVDRSVSADHADLPALGTTLYVVPVEGVRRETLRDSYSSGSGGQLHRAIDIAAPRGTPVVAAAAGTVLQLRDDALGGLTAMVATDNGRLVHYYAHLDGYAYGLREGQSIRAGQRLGYVGTAGDAQGAHLHFAAWRITNPNRFWQGEIINPYPMLRGQTARRDDAERPVRASTTSRPAAGPSVEDPVRQTAAATGRRAGW